MERVNKEKIDSDNSSWSFTNINYVLFFIGIFSILIGYILMYSGGVDGFLSLKLSSLFLILGYCFIIPLSILYKN
tara:strand:+ start:2120 stop:2344 length:225 start_codon:yes stop_codon:yes gene_type:complete